MRYRDVGRHENSYIRASQSIIFYMENNNKVHGIEGLDSDMLFQIERKRNCIAVYWLRLCYELH